MKVSYISLGCAKNQVDFEYLIGELSADGFETELDPAKCDAVIVNTCGFIEPAVKEAIDNILLMAETIPQHAKLVVTGCMAERYKADIQSELPEIDFLTGVGDLTAAGDYLRDLAKVQKRSKGSERILVNSPYFAFIKVSEGCNNRCSYCTIPSIRGNLKSRTPESILTEAKELVQNGVKEIIIVSQDTTKYEKDLTGEVGLVKLLTTLTSELPDTMFRLLYLNPDGVTDELIEFIAKTDNVIKYFEIPVQHASDNVLKAMNRHSNKQMIVDTFNKIRQSIPEAFIRTTFIVGFPTETEEDFQEAVEFLEQLKPDFAGFFPYYEEDGTKAATIVNEIPEKVVAKRIKKLQTIQKRNTVARLKSLKKSEFLCFVDKTNDDFEFILEGRALFQAPEIDGKLYVTDGIASNGSGPYKCFINKIAYPDIYVTMVQGE